MEEGIFNRTELLLGQNLTRSIANMGPGPCERKPKEE